VAVSFASGVLFTSIARTAQIRYSFRSPTTLSKNDKVLGESISINYFLPYPGRVLPDHPLWTIKVLRDKLWLLVSPKPERKAELNLLFADKRLVSAKMLFERKKAELAYSTLTKAEKYLERAYFMEMKARKKGVDTSSFLERLARSCLKHREVIEEILEIAPEDAKPMIIKVEGEYPNQIYEKVRDALFEKGLTPPENPFEG
jgi:HEPN domain-containing protein